MLFLNKVLAAVLLAVPHSVHGKGLSACIDKYPGYEGDIDISDGSKVTVRFDDKDMTVRFHAKDIEANCVNCGVHIHSGTTCDDADLVGGHYWDSTEIKETIQFTEAPAPLEIDLDVFGEVHPAKMDIGPDGKLYFTGGTDSRAYRGDIEGNFEMFAEITTGAGFTLGCQFDKDGNYYMVNGAGVYMIPAATILDTDATLPIEPEMFYEWTTGPYIPMSIDIDDNTGMAYVTDMGLGEIWRIDTATREGAVWASSTQPGYELLYGDPESTNFLGVPFGAVEVMVDGGSDWLYFSAHERNYFGRIKILENGDAGDLQVLATVGNRAALNGAFLDVRNNKFYGATPFLNFHNGIDRDPKATRGGEIWMLDLDDVDEDGNGGKAVRVWQDLDYGTLTDVITGYGFGDENDLYLLDGSFDTLIWPTGIVPDPDAPYHGAVRKLTGTVLQTAPDPWTSAYGAVYNTDGEGMDDAMYRLNSGYDFDDNLGHAAVVHASDGTRIGCGVLSKGRSAAKSCKAERTVLQTCITKYPGYDGDLDISGKVAVRFEHEDMRFRYMLDGADTDCEGCGIHIHTGTTCDDASLVGGHYWDVNTVEDPWTTDGGSIYQTNSDGLGFGNFDLNAGFDAEENIGHAVVVHAKDGSRYGCGILSTEAATDCRA